MPTVTVRVVNAYDNGTEVITTPTADVPAPPDDDREEWWYECIFPVTGTGRTEGNAYYSVEIIESDVPALVGLTYEFG
ncbi:hypothetical protein [Streptomyces roseolus]|uniref:hypothetical protein n=1 Tax=Streptomyces roseolus TaxID=67358 RepID=UPI0016727ECE|nr:hypothetical protein [Streptomyces roseolus]GGR51877.1 hypothetical protein GCM10010282_51020 [Streptomyces roseolus]